MSITLSIEEYIVLRGGGVFSVADVAECGVGVTMEHASTNSLKWHAGEVCRCGGADAHAAGGPVTKSEVNTECCK